VDCSGQHGSSSFPFPSLIRSPMAPLPCPMMGQAPMTQARQDDPLAREHMQGHYRELTVDEDAQLGSGCGRGGALSWRWRVAR
jgi:hypothetical protein